ncbi:MAG: hypothetical protein RI947_694 [Candidatus Parcubacteria bacterium]|jgi:hypothetical protein
MKKLLLLLLFIGILSGFYIAQQYPDKNVPKTITTKSLHVTERIELAPDKNKEIKSDRNEGDTALDLLKSTTTVTMKGEQKNAFVTGIDGRIADETKKEYWSLYINGKPATVGAGSYTLRSNDVIVWKIETY